MESSWNLIYFLKLFQNFIMIYTQFLLQNYKLSSKPCIFVFDINYWHGLKQKAVYFFVWYQLIIIFMFASFIYGHLLSDQTHQSSSTFHLHKISNTPPSWIHNFEITIYNCLNNIWLSISNIITKMMIIIINLIIELLIN